MITDQPRFIVAEVSKNWVAGVEVTPGSGLLSQQFERVIAHNHARGYRLVSFQVHQMMTGPDELNETIIAVFEAIEAAASPVETDADGAIRVGTSERVGTKLGTNGDTR